MTGRGAPHGAIAAAAAAAIACSGIPTTGLPSGSPAPRNPAAAIADIATYKGSSDRTGRMPGPGPAAAPVVLWQHDLDAPVAAAPLVVDGQVIAAGQDGVVRGIDGATGVESWTVGLEASAVATPTVADGILYVVTDDGVLRTVSVRTRARGRTAPGFLPESIVTVAGDAVLAGAPGEIVALAAGTGRVLWRSKAPGSDRQAVDGDVAYVGGDGSGLLVAVDLGTGEMRWQFETGGARVLTPAVVDEALYVAVRDVPAGHNVVVRLGHDGAEQWRWSVPTPDRIGGHAVADDRVFVSTDNPRAAVYALDAASGESIWTKPLEGHLVSIPVFADGVVYVAGDREGIVAVDATTGDVLWRAGLGRVEGASLAVTGGLVIAATRDPGGSGRILALADRADRRGAAASQTLPTPAASQVPSPAPETGVRILSVDAIDGPSLLLSTAVAPDGTLYAADMANHRIVVRHPNGTIESWGERGSEPGQFDFSEVTQNDTSTGISVSPDGELIAVGDGGNHRVQLFDGGRRWLRTIGRLGRDDGQFVNACCVTVDAGRRVWVVDPARADVQVFDEDGRHIRTFGEPGRGDGELMRPGSAFVDEGANRLLVPDFGNRRAVAFSLDGEWLRNYTGRPSEGFFLDEVNAVSVDRFGRLLILDTSSQIFVLDRAGKLEATIPNDVPTVGRVELASFAIDDEGKLYFADIGGGEAGRLIVVQLELPLWPEGATPTASPAR